MSDIADALRLDVQQVLTLRDLQELSGLAESMLRELVDYGALEPLEWSASTMTFGAHCVVVARTARRLSHDFELDTHAVAVMLRFVERIESLEAEVRALRAGRAR